MPRCAHAHKRHFENIGKVDHLISTKSPKNNQNMELLRGFKSVLGAQNEDAEQSGSETVCIYSFIEVFVAKLNCFISRLRAVGKYFVLYLWNCSSIMFLFLVLYL